MTQQHMDQEVNNNKKNATILPGDAVTNDNDNGDYIISGDSTPSRRL
jgi:hypothetical protein